MSKHTEAIRDALLEALRSMVYAAEAARWPLVAEHMGVLIEARAAIRKATEG